jgi:predicted nucleic acid-binding protein
MPDSFVDTNVLLYQLSSDTAKAECSEALLREGGAISVQVLNELANVARRKIGLEWAEVRTLTETLRSLLRVVPLDADTHARGLRLCERHGFSVYDGMIVAAALEAGCTILWSEDMHAGLQVEGRLTIRNPFANAP